MAGSAQYFRAGRGQLGKEGVGVEADITRLLRDHPATARNPDTTTAFLAAFTGRWHRKPAPPGALGLRAYQHSAAAAGLALLSCSLS